MSVDQTLNPATKGWREPRDFGTSLELPRGWNTEVIDLVDRVDQLSSHDNCTINCCNHVIHSLTNNTEHNLELFNFLTQEDAKWDVLCRVEATRNLHSRKLFLIVLLNKVFRKLSDEVCLELFLDLVFF